MPRPLRHDGLYRDVLPAPSDGHSSALYSEPLQCGRTVCSYSRAAPGGFESASSRELATAALATSAWVQRSRVRAILRMRIKRLMSVVYLQSEEGKAELRRLHSILKGSYGPFGM